MSDDTSTDTEPLPVTDPPPAEPQSDGQDPRSGRRRLSLRPRLWQFGVIIVSVVTVTLIAVIMVPRLQDTPQSAASTSVSTPPATPEELISMAQLPVQSMMQAEPDTPPAADNPPPLSPEIHDLMESVAQLLRRNDDANLYLSERIDRFDDIVATIAQLGAHVSDLDHRIAMLEEGVNGLAQQYRSAAIAMAMTEEESAPAPPFTLIGIDRWEKKWNAVLQLEDKVTMIEPQSTVAGWQLLAIDPSRRTALFRSASGTETELSPAG